MADAADALHQLSNLVLDITDMSLFTTKLVGPVAFNVPQHLKAHISEFVWDKPTLTHSDKRGIVYSIIVQGNPHRYYVHVLQADMATPEACRRALSAGLEELARGHSTVHNAEKDATDFKEV